MIKKECPECGGKMKRTKYYHVCSCGYRKMHRKPAPKKNTSGTKVGKQGCPLCDSVLRKTRCYYICTSCDYKKQHTKSKKLNVTTARDEAKLETPFDISWSVGKLPKSNLVVSGDLSLLGGNLEVEDGATVVHGDMIITEEGEAAKPTIDAEFGAAMRIVLKELAEMDPEMVICRRHKKEEE